MKHLSGNSLVRCVTAGILTLCMILCGGCISISFSETPGQAPVVPGTVPQQTVVPDTSIPPMPTAAVESVPSQYWVELNPTSVPPTEAPTEEETTRPEVDYSIDWDSMTVYKEDPNELTRKEFEELVEQNPQMADIMELIGPFIDIFGFAYDPRQDIFYSTKYPVQRIFGYNSIYDAASSPFGLFYLTQRIRFTYDGKEWMVQLWKGQYGATVGGEVGIYYRDASKFIRHFETVEDKDMVIMGFQLCKNGKPYLERGPERHWWLTGFRILDVAVATQLHMVIYFDWEIPEMATAFELGLNKMLLTDITYVRDGTRFWLTWTL